MSFYVTLPSNVNNNSELIENKTSEYLTIFPDSLVLEGPYEVALSEIIYYQNWNFKLCDVYIRRFEYEEHYEIYTFDGETDMEKLFKIINEQLKVFCADFKAKTLEHVLKDLEDLFGPILTFEDRMAFNTSKIEDEERLKSENCSIEAVLDVNSITFNVSTPLVVQFVGAINSLYKFDPIQESYLLNPKNHKLNSTIFDYTSTEPMELFHGALRGIHSIFIYSDVIDTQIVGDSRTRLLRVINVSSKYREVVSRVYDNPDYLPVSSREINSIKIMLRDDTGQKILFTNSKVIVKLHFRKKRYF